jgi:hypothetical protein
MNRAYAVCLSLLAAVAWLTASSLSYGAPTRGATLPSGEGDGSCSDDGYSTAPSGLPQHPDLLQGYKKISPCRVAGVNYPVGYGSTALRDPINCECLPSGVSADANNHFIRVVNTPNVTLDGFDFSLHGGYLLYCDGSANLTITNSNFAMGANHQSGAIGINSGCTNMRITNSVFDGVGNNYPCGNWSVVTTMGAGVTLQYNWIKNFSQHVLEANGGGAVIYRHNLIEEGGWCPGAHLNFSQLQGTYSDPQILFNTFVQHVQAAGGEGIQLEATSSIKNARVEYNTLISVPNGGRRALSYMIACHQDRGAINEGFVAKNNYLDTRGAYGAFYPRQCISPTYVNNWNMVTGIAFPNYP